ncbi:mechanosensitive ion channel family protein [Noviherbaspirillum massiliense]|uniref:mechanosensitive ion channel family protein n=1 Tax=Noviherbaspirillum massiliense TaxID=1465823 RepID=UPI001C54F393|nr:mechanosensitive ion channel family protein [Noviherbaspirillum massiliense]
MIEKLSSYDAMLAGMTFLLTLAILLGLKAFVSGQLRRFISQGRLRFLSYPEQIVDATRVLFLLGAAMLAGVSQLDLSPRQEKWLHYAWIIILVSQIALWANRMVTVAVARAFERHRQTDPSGATHLMLASLVARVVLWSVAVLVALDNLGFNISTLMASLGIGGIAVALAVQNILGDIFSSVSIALDKPFVIGDFIVVDSYMGTVEYVGMKTTRIRSLGGEQIIFSNAELLKNRIRNYKRMQERRVLFEFGVAYETTAEQLERIPRMIKEIISSGRFETRFDRAHFKSYGESALQFEVVYYVLDPDYNKYMDIQQAINLALFRGFEEQGIAFAHPLRKLYMAPAANQTALPQALHASR